MKWRGRRGSRNVVDRRRAGGGAKAAGLPVAGVLELESTRTLASRAKGFASAAAEAEAKSGGGCAPDRGPHRHPYCYPDGCAQ